MKQNINEKAGMLKAENWNNAGLDSYFAREADKSRRRKTI